MKSLDNFLINIDFILFKFIDYNFVYIRYKLVYLLCSKNHSFNNPLFYAKS